MESRARDESSRELDGKLLIIAGKDWGTRWAGWKLLGDIHYERKLGRRKHMLIFASFWSPLINKDNLRVPGTSPITPSVTVPGG